MDYWDWIQDRLALSNWYQMVELSWELGLYADQRVGDKQLPEMSESLGLDFLEPPGTEA